MSQHFLNVYVNDNGKDALYNLLFKTVAEMQTRFGGGNLAYSVGKVKIVSIKK